MCVLCRFKYIYIYICQQVTRKVLRKRHIHEQHPSAAKASFCSVIGVPVCATLACWQVMLKSREIKSEWSLQMDQIPAVPTGLEVGTNPPSLPTGDQRWERQRGYKPLRKKTIMKEGVWAVRSNQSNINVSYVASWRGQERLAPSQPPPEDHLHVRDVVVSKGRS